MFVDFIDFNKVFDKVDHHILLYKLHQLRIGHGVLLCVLGYILGKDTVCGVEWYWV